MTGFNLKSIKQLQSADIEIRDPDGNPTGVVFTMAGPEHPERKRVQFAYQRRLLARAKKTGKVELDDPEEREEQDREMLATFTLGWSGYVDEAGKEVPFSVQAAKEMYADPDMAWLVDQLHQALNEKERFIAKSRTG